jgi:hypothetical protein
MTIVSHLPVLDSVPVAFLVADVPFLVANFAKCMTFALADDFLGLGQRSARKL